MDIHTWEAIAKIVALLAGVIFGSLTISAASLVWVRKQIFDGGGSILCMSGVVLIGLSIWHSVEFGVGASGMSFKAAQQLVDSSAIAARSANSAANAAATALAAATAINSGVGRSKEGSGEGNGQGAGPDKGNGNGQGGPGNDVGGAGIGPDGGAGIGPEDAITKLLAEAKERTDTAVKAAAEAQAAADAASRELNLAR